MAVGIGIIGREVTLTIGGVSILGVQNKGLTVNNEPLDATDETSSGWAEALALPGQKSIELPFSGLVKNLEMLRAIMASPDSSQIYACVLTYPDGTATPSNVTGDFMLGSYTETGEYNGLYTFDVTMTSSGAVTFTPGTDA